MRWLVKTLTSVTGRKAIAAVTGLGLVLFLIFHLVGNIPIFSKSNDFNEHAHEIHSGILIVLADVGLLIAFPLHIAAVISLARDNRKARGPEGYKASGTKQKRNLVAVVASKTMIYGGMLLLAFLVLHVIQFRFNHESLSAEAGGLRGAVLKMLFHPAIGPIYIVGSLLTSWHLFHGIQAAARSLGVHHPRYTPIIVRGGAAFAWILGLGFASIPAWILLTHPVGG